VYTGVGEGGLKILIWKTKK